MTILLCPGCGGQKALFANEQKVGRRSLEIYYLDMVKVLMKDLRLSLLEVKFEMVIRNIE